VKAQTKLLNYLLSTKHTKPIWIPYDMTNIMKQKICESCQTSDSRVCHTGNSDSLWKRLYLDSGTTAKNKRDSKKTSLTKFESIIMLSKLRFKFLNFKFLNSILHLGTRAYLSTYWQKMTKRYRPQLLCWQKDYHIAESILGIAWVIAWVWTYWCPATGGPCIPGCGWLGISIWCGTAVCNECCWAVGCGIIMWCWVGPAGPPDCDGAPGTGCCAGCGVGTSVITPPWCGP